MADQKLMVDSSILIDYFRKTDKSNSKLVAHFRNYEHLYISSVTEFEVVNGATKQHLQFWDGMLSRFTVLDFDSKAARQARYRSCYSDITNISLTTENKQTNYKF